MFVAVDFERMKHKYNNYLGAVREIHFCSAFMQDISSPWVVHGIVPQEISGTGDMIISV